MNRDVLYANYSRLKGWSGAVPSTGSIYLPATLAMAGKTGKLRLLEYGFGGGSFLEWARDAGHEVEGVEILPEAVEAARRRGHQVYLGTEDIAEGKRFDVILAIDVLEHLDPQEFSHFMAMANRHLKEDGVIVAQFPNGDSPFFGRYQYGDYTHLKPLGQLALRQIVMPLGFKVRKFSNLRPLPSGFRERLKRRFFYAVRDIVEISIGHVYFGYRTPMDPNVVAVIERNQG